MCRCSTGASRGVTLLASGEAFYADAVPLLAAATAAVGRALRADRGEPELLRIGHTPSVTDIEVTELLAGRSRAPRGSGRAGRRGAAGGPARPPARPLHRRRA